MWKCESVVGVAGALVRCAEWNSKSAPRGCWLDDPVRVGGESQSLAEDGLGAGRCMPAATRKREGSSLPAVLPSEAWAEVESESESWGRQRGDGGHFARSMAGEGMGRAPTAGARTPSRSSVIGHRPRLRAFGTVHQEHSGIGLLAAMTGGAVRWRVGWSMLSLSRC
jgi:hypothetical protein